MDWAAWGPTLVAIVTAIFTAGALVGRIRSQETALVDHDRRLNGHDAEIKDLGNRMTASEAWREGYNAGRSK